LATSAKLGHPDRAKKRDRVMTVVFVEREKEEATRTSRIAAIYISDIFSHARACRNSVMV
jgi:hypothetical protein